MTDTPRDLEERGSELEHEVHRLREELDRAEFRIEDLSNQVAQRDETILWISSSRIFRLSKLLARALDVLLAPLRAVRGALDSRSKPTGEGPVCEIGESSLPAAKSYDVIRLPVIDWEFRFQRPQHLMLRFARDGHRAFYVRTGFHQDGVQVRIKHLMRAVFGVTLPGTAGLSIYKDELSGALVERMMRSVAAMRRVEGIHDAIVIVDLPFWAPLAEAMRARWGWRIVYDCMDEHSGFATNTRVMVSREDHMIRTSDLVIASARALREKVERLHDNVLHLPNAAEFAHFASAKPTLPPCDVPVIGYYGAISDWFDVDLMVGAAQLRPEWKFVLIGSTTDVDVSRLRRLPNVQFLGEKPYSELPGYVHSFDAVCIPFVHNELTRATNPVKFFEYLAAGKPVLAVELVELTYFREYIYPVSNAVDFVEQAERAMAEDSPERVARRQEFAQQNSWSARYDSLAERLREDFGLVSVVILSYQNLDYMRSCLESVLERTGYPNFEVIVVDNASEPEVVDYLRAKADEDPRVRLILNQENRGFAKGNNQGIAAASGAEYVVLLNNDTIVTPGWLLGLVRYLRNPQIGMVGPVTSFAGNEAKIEVDYRGPEEIVEFASRYTRTHADLHFDVASLAMFCVAIRRSVLDEVGLLDERFGRGMFEDDDYSLRVRAAGYRTVVAEDVFVHHWGEGSFGKLERPDYQGIFAANKRKFEEKWQREWVPHVYRSWPQDAPPPDLVTTFRVDDWRWTCNLCGRAQVTSHTSTDAGALVCRECHSEPEARLERLQTARSPFYAAGIPATAVTPVG